MTPHSVAPSRAAGRGPFRPGRQDGIALIVALLAIVLMTALGMALMLNSQTETLISANYRDTAESAYAADAGIERVMDDVLTVPDWNTLLTSPDGVKAGVTSAFIGSSSVTSITMPDGRTLDLAAGTNMINCGKTTACSDTDMNTSTAERPWGNNNPRFRLYAWGPVNDIVPTGTVNSPYYVAVWVADDAAENDDNPNRDGDPPTNGATSNTGAGVLSLRAESFGSGGAHHVIEATISKTDTTEIERGYTGQRGQDEQNRRARKAAVQTPGKGLTRSEMALGGGMTKQAF